MSTAYFDCFGGAAGDMIVAAMIDADAKLAELREQLARLGLEGYSLTAENVTRGGIGGTLFSVEVDHESDHHHHGRHLSQILEMVDRAGYGERVDNRIRRIFRRLAEAEAKVHRTTPEKIHFHEVGAVDSIVDIVGAAVALELLDVDRVLCSPIPMGSGRITCAHGVLPVPAPATAELMRDGVIAPSEDEGELCTPTGAAVLTTLADEFCPLPAMAVDAIGYGAGRREDPGRINLLRVFVGSEDVGGQVDTACELTANIDDASGEVVGSAMGAILAAGALDVWATPITMKKSRPAVQVSVLCAPSDADAIEEILFRQTTTIGVRRRLCTRTRLERRHETVETPYGAIRMKVSGRRGCDYTVAAEFDDCQRAAEAHNVPVKEIQAAAMAIYRQDRT